MSLRLFFISSEDKEEFIKIFLLFISVWQEPVHENFTGNLLPQPQPAISPKQRLQRSGCQTSVL